MVRKKQSRYYQPKTKPQNKNKKPFDFIDQITAALVVIGAVLASAFGSDGLHTAMVSTVFLTMCIALFDLFRHSLHRQRWFLFAGLVAVAFVACTIWEMRNRQRIARPASGEVAEVHPPDTLRTDAPTVSPPTQETAPQVSERNRNQSEESKSARKREPKPDGGIGILVEGRTRVPIGTEQAVDDARHGYIEGSVRVSDTDQPLADTSVTAENVQTKQTYQTTADDKGSFSLVVPFGEYRVSMSRAGYQPESHACHVGRKQGCYVTFGRLRKMSDDKPDDNRFSDFHVLNSGDHYAEIEVSYYYNGAAGKDDVHVSIWLRRADGSRLPSGEERDLTITGHKALLTFTFTYSSAAGASEQSTQVELCMEHFFDSFHCQRFPFVKTWKPWKPPSN